MLLATVVVCIATLAQIAALLVMRKKVHTLLWVTFALVTVLGGLTVWFHNPTFIKWKPSAVCWAMALVLLVSQLIGKNLLRTLVGKQLQMPDVVWQRLGYAWILFLTLTGVANLYVAFNFSTSAWVSFKVFGLTALNLLFIVAQGFYISRYLDDEEPAPSRPRVDKAAAGRDEAGLSVAAARHRGGAARRAGADGARGGRRQPPARRPCRRARRPALQRPHRQRALQRPVAGRPPPPRI